MAGIWFWVVAGALCFAVGAALLRALARGGDLAAAGPMALHLYTQQLAEIDRDLAKGTLEPAEADRLRTEVQRRMLDAARRDASPARAAGAAQGLGFAAVLAALAGAIGLYFSLGAPDYPDLPLTKRLALAQELYDTRPTQPEAEAAAPKAAPVQADQDMLDLVAQLRTIVASRPTDVQGLTLLAQNEARLGNLAASARAYEAIVAAKGGDASAEDHMSAATAMIIAAGGLITAQAEAELIKALQRDPAQPLARYSSGLLFAQTGRPDRAFEIWEPLLRESPPDAPWLAPLTQMLPEVAAQAGIRYASPQLKGPGAADMAAAADMTEDERRAMITTMVAGLEERLFEAGGTGAEWARLITSLGVLGEQARAKAALSAARSALAADPAAVQLVTDAATQAGLTP